MKAKLTDYLVLTIILLSSSCCSNLALGHINYPTKVVFRSCKLVPTMIIALLWNHKHIHNYQFFYGSLLSIGMVFFIFIHFINFICHKL